MRITFLGTSSGAPSRTRNVSGIALQLPERAALWLFDCGEGTQHQFLRSPLRLSQLEKVFLTHLHGDHLFGLPGLLASRSLQNGGTTPVTLHGPPDLAAYIQAALGASRTRLGYALDVQTIAPGVVYADDDFEVVCAPVEHGAIDAFAYAVVEREQPGRFDVERAKTLGVPEGPLFGRLKHGEAVTLEDGRTIQGADLTGVPRPGRKVVFGGDTTYAPRLVELAQNADVLVHEATYNAHDVVLAERARHATAATAARVAKEAGVGTLILTHFSARYEGEQASGLSDLLADAQKIFPNTLLAHDFYSHTVVRREPD